MQTDILLKQIKDRINQLRLSLSEFEMGSQPPAENADLLYAELQRLAKLVGAYAYIRQQHELSPQLDLHVKVSQKLQSETPEPPVAKPVVEAPKPPVVEVTKPVVEIPKEEVKPVTPAPEPVLEKREEPVVPEAKPEIKTEIKPEIRHIEVEAPKSNYPPISVSINDKFRFINELFKSNAVEYGIAIEQVNAINTWPDVQLYLNGLRNIYGWDEESDMVKKIYELARKRFS
jgi:hypothetical protein